MGPKAVMCEMGGEAVRPPPPRNGVYHLFTPPLLVLAWICTLSHSIFFNSSGCAGPAPCTLCGSVRHNRQARPLPCMGSDAERAIELQDLPPQLPWPLQEFANEMCSQSVSMVRL